MEINGKVYRNLEGQVGYLTDKYDDLQNQINDVRAHLTHYVEVDQLPTGDDIDPSAVYLLGPMGTSPDQYYEEWVYVQKADESWTWEKLGDTDSVDLSGYLPIQDGTTTLPQVYGKTEAGVQAMLDVDIAATAMTILFRDANGRTKVAAPSADGDAANKKYCDDGFVAKQTGATLMYKVYGKATDGTQGMLDVTSENHGATLVFRDANGRTKVAAPSADGDAANKKYCDDGFVAKQTGATTFKQAYAKDSDGSQYMQVINGRDWDAGVDRIALYGTDGRLRVGTPVNDKDAATKKYVDDSVGQLIYKHDITLGFTVSSNHFSITINLLNGNSTAYTSVDGRQLLAYLKSGAYSIVTESYAASKFWSVAVCPSDKYIHTDTGIGFILTAGSDGSTIHVDGIDPLYNTDITGVTITDTVTTW